SMNSGPRWLISTIDAPASRHSSISDCARRRTGSGRVAGPALKFQARDMRARLSKGVAGQYAPAKFEPTLDDCFQPQLSRTIDRARSIGLDRPGNLNQANRTAAARSAPRR